MTSLEDDLSKLYRQHQQERDAQQRAREQDQAEQQAFLSTLRDRIANNVFPVLERIAQFRPPDGSKYAAECAEDGHSATLSIGDKFDKDQLIFRGNPKTKRAVVSWRFRHGPEKTEKRLLEPAELTEDVVEQEIKEFVTAILHPKST